MKKLHTPHIKNGKQLLLKQIGKTTNGARDPAILPMAIVVPTPNDRYRV
ncbi:unnamed protein product [Paramecium octaurelia]|uniref:Uncharacterized protein n=1 Tax=Paramecium octaurelia TaxID=43137 RepID=A0A8S1WDV5_PAROT|nr:unnamed protein product [Paramecium octaurelia]